MNPMDVVIFIGVLIIISIPLIYEIVEQPCSKFKK